jgi:hypothetical protein
MTHLRWPLVLVATALLLGAGVSVATSGSLDWLAGLLAGLGAVALGAWLGSMTWVEDQRAQREEQRRRQSSSSP